MTKERDLKKQAKDACELRNHQMKKFFRVDRNDNRPVWEAHCQKCGAWVEVLLKPLPNEINIFGVAVATNCKEK